MYKPTVIRRLRRWLVGAVFALGLALSSCWMTNPAYSGEAPTDEDCYPNELVRAYTEERKAQIIGAWVDAKDPRIRMIAYYEKEDDSVSLLATYGGDHPWAGYACVISVGEAPAWFIPQKAGDRAS